jgi:hypothetical protein
MTKFKLSKEVKKIPRCHILDQSRDRPKFLLLAFKLKRSLLIVSGSDQLVMQSRVYKIEAVEGQIGPLSTFS